MATTKAPDDVQLHSILIRAPQQKVWDELTKTNVMLPYYFETSLDAEWKPGGRFRFYGHGRDWIHGEVVEFSPITRFSHTFRFTHFEEPPQKVTFELATEDGQTRVTVRHENLAKAPKHAKSVKGGWPHILKNLKSVIEAGKLPLGTRLQYRLMKIMMPLAPKPKAA